MTDILIMVDTKTAKAYCEYNRIGVKNANLQNKLIFEMSQKISGIAWLEYEINGTKNYALMEETEKGYQIDIKSCLLVSSYVNVDLKITENENAEGIPVFISTIVELDVYDSIAATEEEPEQYPTWIELADSKISQMDALKTELERAVADGDFDGATFIPSVSNNGDISWTNDKNLNNPQTVNIKGPKGDAGAIHMLVVEQLPTQNIEEDAIYLVPLDSQESNQNNYAEYIYVNNTWELLGKIGVQVDLIDYIKNTDYATIVNSGVFKCGSGLEVNSTNGYVYATNYNYNIYNSASNNNFISKGTLENVISGKGLTTKAYVDGLVGDINDALDLLNGEVI